MRAPLQTRNDSNAAQTDITRTIAQKPVLTDQRPEEMAQRKLAEMVNNSPRVLRQGARNDAIHNSPRMVAQRHEMNALFGEVVKSPRDGVEPQGDGAMPAEASLVQHEERTNKTGLPDQLKSGIESLSGISMDHVKVHYNSDKPAQLQAHAYAQGSEIHLGAGQERHLPHEAWHVVQQAQGRVRPTLQMQAGVVNDDPSLEKEADMMGKKAAQFNGHYVARSLVTEERVAGVAGIRHTMVNRGARIMQARKLPNAVLLSLLPRSIQAAPVHGNMHVVQRFKTSSDADEWLKDEKAEILKDTTGRLALRMALSLENFEDALKNWKTYGDVQLANVLEAKNEFDDARSWATHLQELEMAIQGKLTREKAANTPLEALATQMKNTNWLYSYATVEQKARMEAVRDNLKSSSASRIAYLAQVNALLQLVEGQIDVSEKVKPFVKSVKTSFKAIPDFTKHDPQLYAEGENLIASLTNTARTKIDALLQQAIHAPSLIDVENGALNEIRDQYITEEMSQLEVKARIKNALDFQYAPKDAIWLSLLKLSKGEGGAWVEQNTGNIGNFSTHATLYPSWLTRKDLTVTTSPPALKELLLGSNVTGYHCTVETPESSANRPHSYRGGHQRLNWVHNSRHFAPLLELAVATAFNTLTTNLVATAEARIQQAITDKGAGLQQVAVKRMLKDGSNAAPS